MTLKPSAHRPTVATLVAAFCSAGACQENSQ